MKVGIVGSRNFPNLGIVAEYVRKLPKGTIVVSGGARGVDQTAATIARKFGLVVEEFLPDWKKDGKAAGFVRNDEIVNASARIVAFWDGQSGGTLDTIEKARAAGVQVTVIRPNGSHFDEKPTNENAFDNDDPQDGATKEEYEDGLSRESSDDDSLLQPDRAGAPKVKLLTIALKWICTAKPKERKAPNGTTRQYFTQALFTVRGNCVVLSYDRGTHPLTAGAGKGAVVEIFGRDISYQPNDDKSKTAFVVGAEVCMRRTGESTPAPHKKAALSVETRDKNRKLRDLQYRYLDIEKKLRWDDAEETRLAAELARLAIEIRRVENGEDIPAEMELKAIVREQHADDSGTIGEEVNLAVSDSDADRETLDHDDDGAELERSTEPWADSSIPLGATVDADCWDCPARLGSICQRLSVIQACILA